jgi:hypothetical protein
MVEEIIMIDSAAGKCLKASTSEISIKGKTKHLSVLSVMGKEIYRTGKFIHIARIKDEIYGDDLEEPENIINTLYNNRDFKADIFTFWQGLPPNKPRLPFHMEWDNIAALPVTTYDYWLKEQVHRMVRKSIRKAGQNGLEVGISDFNDILVQGIYEIFNETLSRQGKKFWHYGKDVETVKKEMARDLDRSEFIGANFNGELVGVAKIIFAPPCAHFAVILSKIKYREIRPNNALIAMAVKICEGKGIPYLTYGNYIYGKKGEDSLSEFKKHNGFLKIDLPRYFIPLNIKGSLAIKLKLHREASEFLPKIFVTALLKIRSYFYSRSNIKDS